MWFAVSIWSLKRTKTSSCETETKNEQKKVKCTRTHAHASLWFDRSHLLLVIAIVLWLFVHMGCSVSCMCLSANQQFWNLWQTLKNIRAVCRSVIPRNCVSMCEFIVYDNEHFYTHNVYMCHRYRIQFPQSIVSFVSVFDWHKWLFFSLFLNSFLFQPNGGRKANSNRCLHHLCIFITAT